MGKGDSKVVCDHCTRKTLMPNKIYNSFQSIYVLPMDCDKLLINDTIRLTDSVG